MSNESPAEITWRIMLIAKEPTQIAGDGRKTNIIFTDPNEVCWIRFLARDDLIEVIDDHGLVAIQGITAKGSIILDKVPCKKKWIKVIGSIISDGDSISVKSIEERRFYRKVFSFIKEWMPIFRK